MCIISSTLLVKITCFAEGKNIPSINDEISEICDEAYFENESLWENIITTIGELPQSVIKAFSSVNNIEDLDTVLLDESYDKLLFLGYENLILEEYVVDVINYYNDKTVSDLDKWEYNLDYLVNNYDRIQEDDFIDMSKIDAYIEMYSENNYLTNNQTIASPRTISNPSAAKSYIEKYYANYNPAYPDWSSYGGDCANFVSQVLYAGGKGMIGTPGTSTAAESVSNWFSSGSSCNTKNVSSSWRGANAFKNHWSSRTSYSTYKSSPYSANGSTTVGDAVSLLNANGVAIHTMVVYEVKYVGSTMEIILAAHTSNTKTAYFSSKYNIYGGGAMVFKM